MTWFVVGMICLVVGLLAFVAGALTGAQPKTREDLDAEWDAYERWLEERK